MLVQDFLENSADRLPDKVALVCDNQRLTYAEIESQANRLANAMSAAWREARRPDRYLSAQLGCRVVGIFAALKAGGVFVVINSTTKQDKLISILNNCRATALVTTGRNPELTEAVTGRCPFDQVICPTGPATPDTAGSRASAIPKHFDPAIRCYPARWRWTAARRG